jgi:DNA-binding CsgD family transcriptional regulator
LLRVALDDLIDAGFHVLHAAVRSSFVSAFYRSTGEGLLRERDSLGRESDPGFMRRYIELTPALAIAKANRGIRVLTTRTALPRSSRTLKRMAFYREIMRPQGWRHTVSLCFWGNPEADVPIFVMSVYRSTTDRDFTKQEVAALERLHPLLDCAVNRLYEREAAAMVRDGMIGVVSHGVRAFAILDGNLAVIQATDAARESCAAWLDDGAATPSENGSPAWCLPAVLANTCREMHHEWQTVVRDSLRTTGPSQHRTVTHPRVQDLTAAITMIRPNMTGVAAPTFVLEFDRVVHGVALDTPDRSLPILQTMTATERAVAFVLADGLSNQEIADKLGKSVHAVKFLLHTIYRKSGVASRAALVAVLRSRWT